MTGPVPGPFSSKDPDEWLRQVAAELTAAGFTTDLNGTAAGLDLAAVLRRPGRREIEVLIDADGYVELRWWAAPGAPAAEVSATIVSASNLLEKAASPAPYPGTP